MKALIVDDTLLNVKVAKMLLEKLNIDVESVSSGIECLEKVKTTRYDIIFMDIMMPVMDGVETFKELQKIEGFNIPVIALTADAVAGAKEKYLDIGFYGYIPKPINIELFKAIMQDIGNY